MAGAALLVKFLPFKYKDLSLVPRTRVKTLVNVHIKIPALEGGGGLRLAGQLTNLLNKIQGT